MDRFLAQFVGLLIAARWPLFAVAVLVAAAAYGPARQVRFDRSVEKMFAADDPLLPPYQRLKQRFGGNEVVMAVYRDEQLMASDGSGIERLAETSRRMRAVSGVRDVLSLAEVNVLLERGTKLGGMLDLLGKRDEWKGPAILDPNSPLAARYRELFTNYTHSADGKTAAVVCMLEPAGSGDPRVGRRSPDLARAADRRSPETVGNGSGGRPAVEAAAGSGDPRRTEEPAGQRSPHAPREESISRSETATMRHVSRSETTTMADPRRATIEALERIIRGLPDGLAPGVLAGEPVMIAEGFALLEEDGRRLGTWTTLLLGLTILVFFRSLRWLVIPIAVVQWALVVTRAALVLSGLSLSMVSSMLAAIVTVVGVATVMHLIVHVRELRTLGLTQHAALATVGTLLAGPILGAILTDVAGFGALCWASVEPVRDFGTMMVAGSLLVIPAICLLVPALALAGSAGGTTPKPGWGEVHIGYWLMRSVDALQARPKTVAAVAAAIALVAAIGTLRLEVETDFTRNFRPGSRVVRAYEFVETNLGGAGVWDVIVPAPPTLHGEYLARVRGLEKRLRAIQVPDPATGRPSPALTKVISLVDALKAAEAEPALALLSPELRYQGLAAAMPAFMAALRSTEADEHGQGRLRIMLRARERQPAAQKRWLINEVTRLAREEFPPSNGTPTHSVGAPVPTTEESSAGAEVTGFFVLLTKLIESMLRDQWMTFAIASAGIVAMVWIGFRSLKYGLIAMIPNAVPIYMVMGLLGWLGLKINMGAAMIAAVSMGMSVDSSIHYYSAFRHARRAGRSVHEALTQCQQSVGLAMIFSTVALIIGFGVLVTSEFVPTIYFGALMSLAMLGGMLGNLIVLPLVLSWTERD